MLEVWASERAAAAARLAHGGPAPACQARARADRGGGLARPPGRRRVVRALSVRGCLGARRRRAAASLLPRPGHRPAEPRRGRPVGRGRRRDGCRPSRARRVRRHAGRRADVGRRRRAPARRRRPEPRALPRRRQGRPALGLRGRRRGRRAALGRRSDGRRRPSSSGRRERASGRSSGAPATRPSRSRSPTGVESLERQRRRGGARCSRRAGSGHHLNLDWRLRVPDAVALPVRRLEPLPRRRLRRTATSSSTRSRASSPCGARAASSSSTASARSGTSGRSPFALHAHADTVLERLAAERRESREPCPRHLRCRGARYERPGGQKARLCRVPRRARRARPSRGASEPARRPRRRRDTRAARAAPSRRRLADVSLPASAVALPPRGRSDPWPFWVPNMCSDYNGICAKGL